MCKLPQLATVEQSFEATDSEGRSAVGGLLPENAVAATAGHPPKSAGDVYHGCAVDKPAECL